MPEELEGFLFELLYKLGNGLCALFLFLGIISALAIPAGWAQNKFPEETWLVVGIFSCPFAFLLLAWAGYCIARYAKREWPSVSFF